MMRNLGSYRHSDFGAALHPSRVTSGIASETRNNSFCDTQVLGGASRAAEVVGPVTLWHEACRAQEYDLG
jgi:hypothetical protein